MSTAPVRSRIGSVRQITGRKRPDTRATDWSRPSAPSARRSIISAAETTAAMERMWIVCTSGTTQAVRWIARLTGVPCSHAQKRWIELMRRPSWPRRRDALDLGACVLEETGHRHRRARGRVLGKGLGVDLVHGREVGHVGEEDGALDDVLHGEAHL